jgi:hypothetical protein
MKIGRIETFILGTGSSKDLLFCRIEPEDGLHGRGEASLRRWVDDQSRPAADRPRPPASKASVSPVGAFGSPPSSILISSRRRTASYHGCGLEPSHHLGGTDGSNPAPSRGESTNHRFRRRFHLAVPLVRILFPPAWSPLRTCWTSAERQPAKTATGLVEFR